MSDTPHGREAVRRIVEQARTSKGLTKDELAEAAGISVKTLYNFQSGDRWPLLRALRGMERALDLTAFSLDDVLTHETPEGVTLAHVTEPEGEGPVEANLSAFSDRELVWELVDRLQARDSKIATLTERLARHEGHQAQ